MPWAEFRSCSALSRLRASSTHVSGKLAIEAASLFLIAPGSSSATTGRKATRLGYRSSGTVERQHDTKAVRRRKIALAPLCPRPRQFSESHDDLVVIGGIPTLEGRILMSDGAGARSRSSCYRQQRRSPTASCHSNPIGVIAGSGYIVRELSLFPSRFAQRDSHPQVGPESSNPLSSSSQSVSVVNPEAESEKPRTLAAVCG